jgi:hypothetical protein
VPLQSEKKKGRELMKSECSRCEPQKLTLSTLNALTISFLLVQKMKIKNFFEHRKKIIFKENEVKKLLAKRSKREA